MRKAYDEIMDHIVVTDEMRARILRNIRSADSAKKGTVLRFPNWKRYAAIAACFAALLLGALTLPGLLRSSRQPASSADLQTGPNTVVCSSADELSKQLGFPISDVTALPFEPSETAYLCSWGNLGEIDYTGADGRTAVYRKSPGTDNNSGVYDSFPDTEQLSVGSVTAAVSGDGTQFALAVWTDGTYAYSIVLSDGVSLGTWQAILGSAG